jgi:hypothetical protein
MSNTANFGPWTAGLDPAERVARFRSLASITAVFVGSASVTVEALRRAEDGDQESAALAFKLFEALPALTKRRILSTWGTTNLNNKFRRSAT